MAGRQHKTVLVTNSGLCRAKARNGSRALLKPSFWDDVARAVRVDRAVAKTTAGFDAELNLLNTPDGTVNLTSGHLQTASSDDFITKCTRVSPKPAEEEDTLFFREIVNEVCCGDKELAR